MWSAKVPGADAATFQKCAEAAETGCPVSKVLKAKITMNAKLEYAFRGFTLV